MKISNNFISNANDINFENMSTVMGFVIARRHVIEKNL